MVAIICDIARAFARSRFSFSAADALRFWRCASTSQICGIDKRRECLLTFGLWFDTALEKVGGGYLHMRRQPVVLPLPFFSRSRPP